MPRIASKPDPVAEFAALFARTTAGNLCHLADGVMLTVFRKSGLWWWAIDEGGGVPTYFSPEGYETEAVAMAALCEAW